MVDRKMKMSSKSSGTMTAQVEQIWSKSAIRLSQFIRARVTDPATAEDILHDVYVKFVSRIDEFRDPAKVEGWLFLVTRNAIIDYYRTHRPTSELTESLPVEQPGIPINEIEELHVVFHRIVNRLPEPYREALTLTAFEGLTQEELAKRLGISLSGAKSRVQRGREQLKRMLLDFCDREFSHAPGSSPCPYGLVARAPKSRRVAREKRTAHKNQSKPLR
jgi:RNA polymerase sigma-70 factor (ECF subfamily)